MSFVAKKIVNTPSGDRPLRVFRATIPIRVTVNTVVDAVEIDPANTILQGVFEPYGFNALAASAPVTAQRSSLATLVLITLDQPLAIQSIRVSQSAPLAANFTLAFYRVDGTTVAEKPTAIAPLHNRLAALATPFVDSRFAVQLRDAMGTPVSLSPTHLTEINVQSYPTTPRLGILDETAIPSSLLPIWQAAGEIGRSVPSAEGQVNAGAALATTLQRYLNAHPERLNTDLQLIAESDAPCQFDLSLLTLATQYVLQRFSIDPTHPPTPKQILRFAGREATHQTLHLPQPDQSQLVAATLELSESLRPQTVATTVVNETSDLPVLDPPMGNQGVRVHAPLTAIQQVPLAQAMRVSGMALGVMAIAPNTTLRVAVYADQAGYPTGQPIAVSDLPLPQAGHPTWAIATFSEPVVLFAQPYWIALAAPQGSAFWLTQPSPGSINLVEDGIQFQPGQASRVVEQQVCRYRWLSPAIATPPTGQPTPPVSSLQLRVGEQVVKGHFERGKWHYDLTASCRQPSTASAISLVFSTTSTGSITVYPPRLVFKNATGAAIADHEVK